MIVEQIVLDLCVTDMAPSFIELREVAASSEDESRSEGDANKIAENAAPTQMVIVVVSSNS